MWAWLPVLFFLPRFAWIAFAGWRHAPLTEVEWRRARVVGSIGVAVALAVGAGLFAALVRPGPVAVSARAVVVRPPAAVAVPAALAPRVRVR